MPPAQYSTAHVTRRRVTAVDRKGGAVSSRYMHHDTQATASSSRTGYVLTHMFICVYTSHLLLLALERGVGGREEDAALPALLRHARAALQADVALCLWLRRFVGVGKVEFCLIGVGLVNSIRTYIYANLT